MAIHFLLSEADRDALRLMLAEFKQRRLNTLQSQPKRQDLEDFHQAPEVYVIKAPVTGIPLLAPETGTGTESDPGFADCDVYKVVTEGLAPPELEYAGFDRTVYNLSTAAIPGGSLVLACRDKYGSWFAVPTAIGGTTTNSSCRLTIKGTGDLTIGSSTPVEWSPASVVFDPYSWDSDGYLVMVGTAPSESLITLPFDGEYEVTFNLKPAISSAGGGTNIEVGAAVIYDPVVSGGGFLSLNIANDSWTRVSLLHDSLPNLNASGTIMAKAGDTLELQVSQDVASGNFKLLDDATAEQNCIHVRYLGPRFV